QYQEAINVRFSQAAKDIEQVKTLEEQKSRLLDRAELTTALIEKIPRTVLLAELINRMPAEMTLLEFELEAKAIKVAKPAPAPSKKPKSVSSNTKARTTEKPKIESDRPVAPRYEIEVTLVGVTPTHAEVAEYVASLKDSPILREVNLRFSEFIIMEDQGMNKFRIDAVIHPDVDARKIEPMAQRRRGLDAISDDETGDEVADADDGEVTTAEVPGEGDWQ
ncbi:MAG: PilN domain-containing protein, partial [Phycisphaerales bacterium]|nr:PilN domain-containing protein [Phycisphaerales bacterium]